MFVFIFLYECPYRKSRITLHRAILYVPKLNLSLGTIKTEESQGGGSFCSCDLCFISLVLFRKSGSQIERSNDDYAKKKK